MSPRSRTLVALATLGVPGAALAADDAPAPFDAHNLHFLPNDGDPRDPLTLRRPGRFAKGDWYAGMVWEFADALATQTLGPDEQIAILDNTFGVHVGGGWALHDRLRLDAALPLYLVSIHETDTSQGIGAGDLRIGAALALVRPEDTSLGGGFGLALNPWLDAPTGSDDQWLSHPGWGGGATVGATYETEKMTFSGEVGMAAFPREVPGDFSAGDGLVANVGVGYLVQEKMGVNLEYRMGPTLVATEDLGAGTPMELWGTTRKRFDDGGHILAGLAMGLNDAAGTADWRAVIGGGFGKWDDPTPPDADGDGLHDKIDQCVDQPETANGWKDEDGCPDQLSSVSLHATWRGADVAGVAVTLVTPEGEQALKTGDKPIEFQALPELPLTAKATAGCLAGEASVTTAEGAVDFTVPLAIADETKVAFSVKNEDGEAVPKATVRFRNAGERQACAPLEDLTANQKGAAVAQVAPGEHAFVVQAKGYAIYAAQLDTKGLEGPVEVVLKSTKIKLTEKDIQILEKVFFETGSGVILDKSFGLLDEIATTLKANPQIRKVEIQGHTDDRGQDAANLKLSQTRADSVVKYLVDKGVAAERLQAKGYGETTPIDNNKTSAGRANNRRVDFKILEQGKAEAAIKKEPAKKAPEKTVLEEEGSGDAMTKEPADKPAGKQVLEK
jgi:outer membrane protein OmpA-like peptidoglycan-associated protein